MRLATLLLLVGIVLGPQGLAVLTPEVIEVLRPAVAVALAVLGVTMVFGPGTYGSFWRTHLPSMLILAGALSLALLHRNAAEAMAVEISNAVEFPVTLSCGDGLKVVPIGDSFECTATDEHGDTRTIRIRADPDGEFWGGSRLALAGSPDIAV